MEQDLVDAGPPRRFSPRLLLLVVALAVAIENTAELAQRGLGRLVGLPASTAAAVLLAAIAVGWARWALAHDDGRSSPHLDGVAAHGLRFLPALAALDTLIVYPHLRPPSWTAGSVALHLAAPVALAVAAAVPAVRGWMIATTALGLGLVFRLVLLADARLPVVGDMQGLVDGGAAALLRGEDPYHWYFLPWAVPLTYLPATLLAYVPGHALGLHPRWTNLVAEATLLALLVRAVPRPPRAQTGAADSHPALLLVGSAYLLQGPLEWLRSTAHVPAWTLLGAALLATARRHRATGPAWGLALAASPFAAPFFPLALAATARTRGARAALLLAAQVALVAAALVLPFFLWSPRAFVEGAVAWFGDVDRFPRLRWTGSHTWREYPGLAGLFWTFGLERWLRWLQLAAEAALVALFVRRRAPLAAVPAYGVAVFLAFVLTNQMLWPYFYQPALVAALCAVVGVAGPSPAARSAR